MAIGDKDLWEMYNQIKKGKSVNVGGDRADATQIRQIINLTQKAQQSIETHAIKTLQQQQAVQENIAKRAELREKKSLYGVPNIAKLLTGGAGGTIGHIGRMQKMAENHYFEFIIPARSIPLKIETSS